MLAFGLAWIAFRIWDWRWSRRQRRRRAAAIEARVHAAYDRGYRHGFDEGRDAGAVQVVPDGVVRPLHAWSPQQAVEMLTQISARSEHPGA